MLRFCFLRFNPFSHHYSTYFCNLCKTIHSTRTLVYFSHSSQDILHELVPLASEREISSALQHADGDVDEAAQSLLGRRNFIPYYFYKHNVACTITFSSFIYVNQGIMTLSNHQGQHHLLT